MHTLIKKNSDFTWTSDCEKAFDSCIQYFDEKKPVILYCDAIPVVISAVLLYQIDGKDPNVIAYSSRSLSDTEKRYYQIERESLSITYACERSRLYLCGRSFTIFCDISDSVNKHKVIFIDAFVNFLTKMATTYSINVIDLKQAAVQDPMLTKSKDLILNHNWHNYQKMHLIQSLLN